MALSLVALLCVWLYPHPSCSQLEETIILDPIEEAWTGDGNVAFVQSSNCPGTGIVCLRLGGDIGSGVGYAKKTFSVTGYHDITFGVKTYATGPAILESYSYDGNNKDSAYGSWNPVCTSPCISVGTPADPNLWDNRNNLVLEFKINSATPAPVSVYLADLEIVGTPYTSNPTPVPTDNPTKIPTASPIAPTKVPTKQPSNNPTALPSFGPTDIPSKNPSIAPTDSTNDPTAIPSMNPNNNPSMAPTNNPSDHPTSMPSLDPANFQSSNPTNVPSHILTSSEEPTSNMPSFDATVSSIMNSPTMNPIVGSTVVAGIIDNESSNRDILIIVIVSLGALFIISCLIFVILYKRKQSQLKTSETKIANKLKMVPTLSHLVSTEKDDTDILAFNLPPIPVSLPGSEIQLEGVKKAKLMNSNADLLNIGDNEDMYLHDAQEMTTNETATGGNV